MNTLQRIKEFASVLLRAPALGQRNVARLKSDLGVMPTAAQTIHVEGAFRLLYVGPPEGVERKDAPPIVLVPSLINRWYVLDLLEGHSLLAALAAAGHAVYVVVWEDAHEGLGDLPLAAWADTFLRRAVRKVRRHSGVARVTLLGQCIGGTLAVAYAARFSEDVDRLVALTTPVDFTDGGLLGRWIREGGVDADRLRAAYPGVVPDRIVYGAFPLLNPQALVTRHRTLYALIDNVEFRCLYEAIDLWTTDHLPVACGALVSMVQELYRDNALWEGRWVVGGRAVRIEDVRCPVLNVVAAQDEIVPPGSATPLLERVGSERKEEHLSPMGHVTLILGSPLRFATYQAIDAFCG